MYVISTKKQIVKLIVLFSTGKEDVVVLQMKLPFTYNDLTKSLRRAFENFIVLSFRGFVYGKF
jgi:hypothetical protein